MNLLQRKYINALSFVGILILIFLSGVSYLQIKNLRTANDFVIHTHEVIEAVDSILNNIHYAESKHRGYFLTGDASYFAQYRDAINNVNSTFVTLQQLVQDNPQQRQRVAELNSQLKERIVFLNGILREGEVNGMQAGLKILVNNQGKLQSDKVNQIAKGVISEEKKLLASRNNTALANATRTMRFEFIATAFSLFIIFLCLFLLNKLLSSRLGVEKKLRDSENELMYLAYYDTMTELPNRALLMKRITQAINEKKPGRCIAVLFLDVDNFKNINDSLGQEAGDDLLRSMGQHLKKLIRVEDTLGYLGSDEFVILLSDIEDAKSAGDVARKILLSLVKPFKASGHRIFTTVSIGVSIYPQNGMNAKALLKNANIAMYRAKEIGKKSYQYCTPEMTIAVEERALLDFDLHHALENQELMLFYQPKISLQNNAIEGVEVLMRWNHPKHGFIAPEEFITLAENNGLIVPISEWLLTTACHQVKRWQAEGLPVINIAINISIRQLIISNFVESLKRILHETKFDPKVLELEITESILMENSYNNFAILRDLQNMGIKVTIDDFGTGYSALSYLRQFNIDKLKIDKSFIQEIQSSEQTSSIINAIIVMAHSMGIKVIAEGVETQEQIDYLKEHGCDQVQGFFYSQPLPPNEIANFFAKNTP